MTTAQIKYLALILMVLDHIATFIDGAPMWFKFVGRVSAPLFFFCMCWGIDYTKNVKRYLLRLYIASLAMATLWCILQFANYEIPYKPNNIFSTLFITAVTIIVVKSKKNKLWKKIIGLLLWQLVALNLVQIAGTMYLNNSGMYLICALTGCSFYCEGGVLWCIFGVLLYYLKDSKKSLIIGYSIICVMGKVASMFAVFPRLMYFLQWHVPEVIHMIVTTIYLLIVGEPYQFTPLVQGGLYFGDYQWLMIGALPIMLMYNHQRGNSPRWLFYVIYPAHILILFLLGAF